MRCAICGREAETVIYGTAVCQEHRKYEILRFKQLKILNERVQQLAMAPKPSNPDELIQLLREFTELLQEFVTIFLEPIEVGE